METMAKATDTRAPVEAARQIRWVKVLSGSPGRRRQAFTKATNPANWLSAPTVSETNSVIE
jgi:hypothetical protein